MFSNCWPRICFFLIPVGCFSTNLLDGFWTFSGKRGDRLLGHIYMKIFRVIPRLSTQFPIDDTVVIRSERSNVYFWLFQFASISSTAWILLFDQVFLCFAGFALSARGVLRWLRSLFQAVYICPTLGVFVVGTKQLASEGGCVRLSFLRFAGFALCARVLCLVSHRLKWCFGGCKRFSRLFSDALLQFSSW